VQRLGVLSIFPGSIQEHAPQAQQQQYAEDDWYRAEEIVRGAAAA